MNSAGSLTDVEYCVSAMQMILCCWRKVKGRHNVCWRAVRNIVPSRAVLSMLHRQAHHKGSSPSLRVLHSDASTVEFYNLFGNAQPKAEMGLIFVGSVGAVETLKDSRFLFIWNAGAIVRYQDPDMGGSIFQRKGDPASGRGVAEGIVDEDGEKLADAFPVTDTFWRGVFREGNVPA